MRDKIINATLAILTAATAPTVSNAQPGTPLVYSSDGQFVGWLGAPYGGSVIRNINDHLYVIDATIQNGLSGYDFLYTTSNCTGQPYVEGINGNWLVWPAQYNVADGYIYGPLSASGGQALAVTIGATVNSQGYNWGTLNFYCSAVNGAFSITPVYKLQYGAGLKPPFSTGVGFGAGF